MVKKKKANFEEQLQKLNAIVEDIEGEKVDLDRAVEKFEEGLTIAADLKKQLAEVENRITTISKKFQSDQEV